MKLLLDTHIWIWFVDRPEKLARSVRRELQKPGNELYLSPVSVWEARTIERRKKLGFKPTFSQWVHNALTGIREAPFNFGVGDAAAGIHLPQSDIGDVFLAATASVYDFTLVTADRQLLACSWLKTMAND